jgi:hypothetical protein
MEAFPLESSLLREFGAVHSRPSMIATHVFDLREPSRSPWRARDLIDRLIEHFDVLREARRDTRFLQPPDEFVDGRGD